MVILLFILGISIGSFLNVLIDRLSVGQDVVRGRSHCDHCHRTLSWYELIPVLSWLLQGGRTRCCRKRLSVQYPIIECVTGIGFAAIFSAYPVFSYTAAAYYLIFASAVVLFVADLKYEVLPTPLLVSAALGVLLYRMDAVSMCLSSHCSPLIWTILVPTGIATLFFLLIWGLSHGRAMGDGDIYLVFLMGVFLGFPDIVIALYAAFLTGALVGVILILGRKKGLKSHISFGPFLIFGSVVSILFNSQIISLWLHLQGL